MCSKAKLVAIHLTLSGSDRFTPLQRSPYPTRATFEAIVWGSAVQLPGRKIFRTVYHPFNLALFRAGQVRRESGQGIPNVYAAGTNSSTTNTMRSGFAFHPDRFRFMREHFWSLIHVPPRPAHSDPWP